MDTSDGTNYEVRAKKNIKQRIDKLRSKAHRTGKEQECLDAYDRAIRDLSTDPRHATREGVDIKELNEPGLKVKYNVTSTRSLYRWREDDSVMRCIHIANSEQGQSDSTVWVVDFTPRGATTYRF